jgi:hypothetical protein
MPTPAQALLASVREKQAEAARLYRTLDLWAAVQAQGIEVECVEAFGFDPAPTTAWCPTPRQRADAQRAAMRGQPEPYTGERLANGHYRAKKLNYVRLKDGRRVQLDPMLDAVS